MFITELRKTIESGGSAIVPVFAVGRAQEIILLILENIKRLNCPIYLDGMSLKINRIILENLESINSPGLFNKAVEQILPVGSTSLRKNVPENSEGSRQRS